MTVKDKQAGSDSGAYSISPGASQYSLVIPNNDRTSTLVQASPGDVLMFKAKPLEIGSEPRKPRSSQTHRTTSEQVSTP